MTSIALHPTPSYRVVAQEQVRAVGLALRKIGWIFMTVLGLLGTILIIMTLYVQAHGGFRRDDALSYGPPGAMLTILVGLLIPFGVWQSEDPLRRAYHWTMPVARGPHTLIKTLSGWFWLMTAIAA